MGFGVGAGSDCLSLCVCACLSLGACACAYEQLKALAREKKSAKKALLKMEKSGPAISAADPRTKGGLSIQRF